MRSRITGLKIGVQQCPFGSLCHAGPSGLVLLLVIASVVTNCTTNVVSNCVSTSSKY